MKHFLMKRKKVFFPYFFTYTLFYLLEHYFFKLLLIRWPRIKYAPLLVCSQAEYKSVLTFIPVKALLQGDLYSHYRLLPFLCKFVIKYSKKVMTNNSGNYC